MADSAYGSGEFQRFLRDERINSRCRTQRPANRGGLYSKDRFDVDLDAGAVTCPAGVRVEIPPRPRRRRRRPLRRGLRTL